MSNPGLSSGLAYWHNLRISRSAGSIAFFWVLSFRQKAGSSRILMDEFSYLSALLSIIIGSAVTQLLTGMRGEMLGRERVRGFGRRKCGPTSCCSSARKPGRPCRSAHPAGLGLQYFAVLSAQTNNPNPTLLLWSVGPSARFKGRLYSPLNPSVSSRLYTLSKDVVREFEIFIDIQLYRNVIEARSKITTHD